ncbi:MAG TPA: EVE domain-containing protein [Ignavibacteria bacterium]|nr:EVE domain-containing protein [Ignavibacteria bacterium]
MAYWLLKTEPTVYSWDNLVKDKKTTWDGVGSPAGLMFIRQMKKGDKAFIYHTGDEKQIVGIGEVTTNSYPDPKEDDQKYVVFDIKPLKKLKRPVTLAEVKANSKYKDFRLTREPRLSVMPVPDDFWDDFFKMSEK